jgi:secreted trypsin-like serine protease
MSVEEIAKALFRTLDNTGLVLEGRDEKAIESALRSAEQRGAREERERCARLAEAEAAEYDSNARACDASGNHLGGTLDTASGMACRYVATALRAAPSPGEEPR